MPSPIIVRFSKTSALTSAGVSLLFLAIGLLAIIYGFFIKGDLWGLLLGLGSGLMGSYGLALACRQLLNRSPQIVMDETTLTDCRDGRQFAWKNLKSANLHEEWNNGSLVHAVIVVRQQLPAGCTEAEIDVKELDYKPKALASMIKERIRLLKAAEAPPLP